MRPIVCLVAAALLITGACTGTEATDPTDTSDPPTTATTTATPSTTVDSTAPPTSTTTVPFEALPAGVALSYRAGSNTAPSILVHNLRDGSTVALELDRRLPEVSFIASDMAGGLVALLGNPWTEPTLVHVARDGHVASAHSLTGAVVRPQITLHEEAPALMYERRTWDTWSEPEVDVMESRTEVVVRTLATADELVLLDHTQRTLFRRDRFEYESDPDRPSAFLSSASYGGGRLVTAWEDSGCAWVEIEDLGANSETVNPHPPDRCWTGGLQAYLSHDGDWLVVHRHSTEGEETMTVHETQTGSVVATAPATELIYPGASMAYAAQWDRVNDRWSRSLIDWTGGTVAVHALPDNRPVFGMMQPAPSIPDGSMLAPDRFAPCTIRSVGTVASVPGIPPTVADMRLQILDAAASCDLVALHALASEADDFILGDPTADVCGDPDIRLLGDDDLVPVLYGTDFGDLIVLLRGDPTLTEAGTYEWVERPGFRIEIDSAGTWIGYDHSQPAEPCETIWCTC